MQKSLDQMNVRVHRAVSDIDGVRGMAILRAIADGERDARNLAKLRTRAATASTRVAVALRMAALSLRNSATALGAYYRRIARRIGGDVAVFATARKLATLIYRLLRWGQQYVDEGAEAFETRNQAIRITALKAKAKELGFELVQNA
jgi:hypothetical protein